MNEKKMEWLNDDEMFALEDYWLTLEDCKDAGIMEDEVIEWLVKLCESTAEEMCSVGTDVDMSYEDMADDLVAWTRLLSKRYRELN